MNALNERQRPLVVLNVYWTISIATEGVGKRGIIEGMKGWEKAEGSINEVIREKQRKVEWGEVERAVRKPTVRDEKERGKRRGELFGLKKAALSDTTVDTNTLQTFQCTWKTVILSICKCATSNVCSKCKINACPFQVWCPILVAAWLTGDGLAGTRNWWASGQWWKAWSSLQLHKPLSDKRIIPDLHSFWQRGPGWASGRERSLESFMAPIPLPHLLPARSAKAGVHLTVPAVPIGTKQTYLLYNFRRHLVML